MKWTDESLFEESKKYKTRIDSARKSNSTVNKKTEYEKYIRFRKILVIGVKRR